MSEPTYYGYVLKSRNPNVYGLVAVSKPNPTTPLSQSWTGEEFRTRDAVITRMNALNVALFESRKVAS